MFKPHDLHHRLQGTKDSVRFVAGLDASGVGAASSGVGLYGASRCLFGDSVTARENC